MMALRTGRKIDRVNKYEQDWKIKTNIVRLNIYTHKQKKEGAILTPYNAHYDYVGERGVLGLKITSNSYIKI